MDKNKDTEHVAKKVQSFDPTTKSDGETAQKKPSSSGYNRKNNGNGDIKASASEKAQRTAAKRQRLKDLRAQNEEKKRLAFEQKQNRKATLSTLSKEDKKTFLATEKEAHEKAKLNKRIQIAKQQRVYAALSPAEQASYRKDMRREKKLEKQAKKGYLVKRIVLYTLLAVLVAGIVYGGILAYGMFFDNSYAFQDTGETTLTQPPKPSETPAPSVLTESSTNTPEPTMNPYDMLLSQADLSFMENRVNILVLGIDESLERQNWGSFRTDTMIFMSIDFETNDVFMISLPRDSFVWIYGQDCRQRINTAFAEGGGYNGNGFEYAMNTVSLLFGGVPVNHYVCFDMNVVKEVVDSIGGLYYDVDIEFTMCGRPMEKGYQHLDGQAVLDYCRERHVDSDIGRTARQRAMLMAIFEEMKNTGQIKDVPAIYSAVTGNIYTDLSFEQICSLAAFAMGISLENIHEYALPGDYLNIDGTSLWGINQYKKRDMVKEIFGIDISVSGSDHVTNLQALAAQKRNVVAAAGLAAASAQSYVDTNSTYILPAELSEFNTKKAELLAVAAVINVNDVESTIQPIIDATDAFNAWFEATFKPPVEERIAAVPTPTPSGGDPTPAPSSSTEPSPSPSSTQEPTSTPEPT